MRPGGGPSVVCLTCGRDKAPGGRLVPAEMGTSYCGSGCEGHYRAPYSGELWPDEIYGESLGHMPWHDGV